MARIDNLTNFLTDVAAAIKSKLGDQTNIPAFEFDNRIMNIPTGGGLDYSNTNLTVENIVEKSVAYSKFTELYPLPNIADMSSAFMDNTNIIYCPLIETSNVTNMSYMFNGCDNLINIPILNMVNVTNAEGMFINCNNLSSVTLENIAYMLPNANNLTNTTVTNLGLNSTNFSSRSIDTLMNKGYTDVSPVYNPNPNYMIIINK